jgi:hypothetical protein
MKAHRFASHQSLHRYMTGDMLFELDRGADVGPVLLTPLGGTTSGSSEPAKHVLDIIKPKAEDYPALTATLQVLKFSADDVVQYHKAIGSVVNLAAGCVSIVGAVFAVGDFIGKLMSDGQVDENTQRLRHLTSRVESIYGFLEAEHRSDLHNQVVAWRADLDNVLREVANARTSRAPLTLKKLYDHKDVLDKNLALMLAPGSSTGEGGANIAFLRAFYGYFDAAARASRGNTPHWVDACTPPFMTRVDGTPLNYRDPDQDLRARIWDPGHYIDVLLSTLQDRLLLLAATEPAFRSTYFDMVQVRKLAEKLTVFLIKWRASMIVADPIAGLNGGGPLANPVSGHGIVIGAVDPVTGIAFFDASWANGPIRHKIFHPLGLHGLFSRPTESRFVDPQRALAGALDLQPRLLAGAVRASGIHRFLELRDKLQAILDRPLIGSDFVDLPNARFRSVELTGPAPEKEHVSLGFFGKFSRNPDKRYEGRRYTQLVEKSFRFDMAMRADVSRTQLGYRLVIAGSSIPLVAFSTADSQNSAVRFPTAPIERTIRHNNALVYDVLQSAVFTAADEDIFEGGTPAPSFGGRLDQTVFAMSNVRSHFDTAPLYRLTPQRVFTNERRGPLAIQVDITFGAAPGNRPNPFAGQAKVTIRNLDPETNRDGAILAVEVYETRVADENEGTEEILADRMTVHLVPSFLVVEPSYFIDREEGMAAVDRIFGEINERYVRAERHIIPVEPEWAVRRRVVEDAVRIRALQEFERQEPALSKEVLGRYIVPGGQL